MSYLEAMTDKFGFDDGESIPVGAEVYRAAFIRFINAVAEANGSESRAVAYDRPGAHNWCLIGFYRKADLDAAGVNPDQYAEAWYPDLAEFKDEAMEQALLAAEDNEVQIFDSVEAIITIVEPRLEMVIQEALSDD